MKKINKGNIHSISYQKDPYEIEQRALFKGLEHELNKALDFVSFFDDRRDDILNLFGVNNKFEVYSGNFLRIVAK